jgi:predicted PurR-regulated permease PerM
MDKNHVSLQISIGTIIKTVLVLFCLYLLYQVRDIAALVLLSIVVASGIEPATAWFQKKKIGRIPSVIFVYILIFSVLGLLFYLIIPALFSQLTELSGTLPSYLNKPIGEQILEALPTLPESVSSMLLEFADVAKAYVEKISGGFFTATSVLFGGAFSFFMVVVLSFYFSVQEKGIETFLRVIIPLQYEDYSVNLWLRVKSKLGAWMKGQLILGLMVGVLVYLCLTIIGIKYALVLALFAAVFELIPIFGPIISSIPAIAMALLQSPTLALVVAVMYFIIQQFENHLIYPLVIRKIVGVPTILTVLALIVGAKLGGFMGILLSMPIVTFLVEISDDIEKKKRPLVEEAEK